MRTNRTTGRLTIGLLACTALTVAGCTGASDDAASIIRTTTNIEGADVIGLERDTTQTCALPSSPDPASGPIRSVQHASGTSQVPADPQRIVVLGTSALDATCALGLWERVVGTTTVAGPSPQPSYLGTGVLEIPGVGPAGQPDPAEIEKLDPDLIIGDVPTESAGFETLQDIAPTVLVGKQPDWREEFTAYGAGFGRTDAAAAALDAYRTEATDLGELHKAHVTQPSLVRFTGDGSQVMGEETFAAKVFDDVGADRPYHQRSTSFDVDKSNLERAEGDLIYVMFAGEEGRAHGEDVMASNEWRAMAAVTDGRVFAMDDALWHTTGPTAARALLTDIDETINTSVME